MGTYQIPESLTATNSEVQMLNVVDERTTETDRAELTEGDDNNDDARAGLQEFLIRAATLRLLLQKMLRVAFKMPQHPSLPN